MNWKPRILSKFLLIFLVLFPFALILCGTIKFTVNMPYADEWALVPFLQKSIEGFLSVRDLFQQHNESRIFFPRLVLISLARLTGWNTSYESLVIVFTALFTFLILTFQSFRTCMDCLGKKYVWPTVFISALIFSLLQYECWSFGFTLVGYMNILFVAAGLFMLARSRFSCLRFVCALAAGIIATYSYSNGALYWLVSMLALMVVSRERRIWRTWPFIVWILVSAGTLVFYFIGYQKPTSHPELLFFIKYPVLFFGYLCAYFGGAVVNIPEMPVFVPVTIGAIGLLIFAISSLACFYLAGRPLKSISPWIALGAYSLLTGLAVAAGRSPYGIKNALASRYTMFSSLFWISTFIMTTILLEHIKITSRLPDIVVNGKAKISRLIKHRGYISLKSILSLFAFICVIFFIISSCYAMKAWKARYIKMRSIQNELLSFVQDYDLLEESLPQVYWLKEWSKTLMKYRLSIFKEKKMFHEYEVVDTHAGCVELVKCDLLPSKSFFDGTFQISGRAYDPERRLPAKAVILVNSNQLIIARANVNPASISASTYSKSSWILPLKASKLPSGISAVYAYALFQDGSRIALIGTLSLETIPECDMKKIFPIDTFIEQPDRIAGFIDNLSFSLNGEYIRIRGWARNTETDKPCKWVIITDNETNILAWARVADQRKDVVKQLGKSQLLSCGWHTVLDKKCLSAGVHVLKAYVLAPEEAKALKLSNEVDVQ